VKSFRTLIERQFSLSGQEHRNRALGSELRNQVAAFQSLTLHQKTHHRDSTTARSDPSTACLSGVRLSAFPDRSPIQRDTAEVSRFSCMLFLMFVSQGCWVL